MTSYDDDCRMAGAVDGLVMLSMYLSGRVRKVDWVSDSSVPVLSVADLNVILEVTFLNNIALRDMWRNFAQNPGWSVSNTDFSWSAGSGQRTLCVAATTNVHGRRSILDSGLRTSNICTTLMSFFARSCSRRTGRGGSLLPPLLARANGQPWGSQVQRSWSSKSATRSIECRSAGSYTTITTVGMSLARG